MPRPSLTALLLVTACGSTAEPSMPAPPAPATTAVAPPVSAPPAAPPTCVLDGDPVVLSPRSGPISVLALGDAFVVAGYAPRDDHGEDIWLARVAPGTAPVELFRTSVAAGTDIERALGSPPSMARIDDHTVAVAVVTRTGHVSAGRATIGDTSATVSLVPVEEGAQPTWAPAVVVVGDEIAIAWTQASTRTDDYMERTYGGDFFLCWPDGLGPPPPPPPPPPPRHDRQVRLAQLDAHDGVRLRRDATPDIDGAWAEAPVPIDGASPPEILFDDPQSTFAAQLFQVGVRADGFVEPRRVRTISSLHDSAMLAAAAAPGGPWLAYMATGADGHSAVALVTLANDAMPIPLVEGNTGRMHVDAVGAGEYAVFAAEGRLPEDDDPRSIHVRAVGPGGAGPALVIEGGSSATSSPALARRASDGRLALGYLDAGTALLRWVRCR